MEHKNLSDFRIFMGRERLGGVNCFHGVNVTSQVTTTAVVILTWLGKRQTCIFMQHYAKMMSSWHDWEKTDLHFHAALCKNDVILIKIKKIFSSYPIWSPCFKLEIYQKTIGLSSLFSEKAIFFRFFGIEWNSIKELFCWAHQFCFYSF